MYDVSGVLPVDSLAPRTHLLAVSPPLLGGREILYQFVRRGLETGDGCVVVTTDRGAAEVAATLTDQTTTSPERVGIVDATGHGSNVDGVPYPVRTVGSPGDLTGIGMAVTGLVEDIHANGADSYRVVVDSLSSMLVYTEFERVYQFVNAITNQIDQVDGTTLSLLNDTGSDEQSRFSGLFDGVVEVREGASGPEFRFQGPDETSEWRPVPDRDEGHDSKGAHPEWTNGTAPGQGDSRDTDVATPGNDPDDLGAEVAAATSIEEIIEAVSLGGETLTVFNHDGGESLSDLADYFGRLNVTVRASDADVDTPSDVAVLHRGADAVAMSPVTDLTSAIRLDAIATGENQTEGVRPDVLDSVARQEFTVDNGGKHQMVRTSRLVEQRALAAGTGQLHTGFQNLARLDDGFGTRELYEAIARTDVEVHLYGRPGPVPNEELYTVHEADGGELSRAWFVVFDGGGDENRMGALVSEETSPGRYSGFWSYQPSVVGAVTTYLESAYGTHPEWRQPEADGGGRTVGPATGPDEDRKRGQ